MYVDVGECGRDVWDVGVHAGRAAGTVDFVGVAWAGGIVADRIDRIEGVGLNGSQ